MRTSIHDINIATYLHPAPGMALLVPAHLVVQADSACASLLLAARDLRDLAFDLDDALRYAAPTMGPEGVGFPAHRATVACVALGGGLYSLELTGGEPVGDRYLAALDARSCEALLSAIWACPHLLSEASRPA